jgi:hypothetical protein
VLKSDELAALLSGSPLLEVVDESSAEVRLVRSADASWAITDDIHGAKPG